MAAITANGVHAGIRRLRQLDLPGVSLGDCMVITYPDFWGRPDQGPVMGEPTSPECYSTGMSN